MAHPSTAPAARAIAGLLGLPGDLGDTVKIAGAVSAGLPAGSAEALRRVVNARTFDAVLPEATYRRVKRQGRPLTRETSEKLYEFARLYARLGAIYGDDPERIDLFLTRPHPMLGGHTPLALATSSSAGSDAVLSLLEAADAGFAA